MEVSENGEVPGSSTAEKESRVKSRTRRISRVRWKYVVECGNFAIRPAGPRDRFERLRYEVIRSGCCINTTISTTYIDIVLFRNETQLERFKRRLQEKIARRLQEKIAREDSVGHAATARINVDKHAINGQKKKGIFHVFHLRRRRAFN